MKLALSLLTYNKPELVEQTCKPLLEAALADRLHLYVVDGSEEINREKIWKLTYPTGHMHANVKGGAGAAIVYALTEMLNHKENYSHVALCESDVLLRDGWLDCLGLFDKGEADGLSVGAVSARCYVDRVLFQRDGYAAMHNLGAGFTVLTREAARLILDTFRTGWTTDNRRIFSQLARVDIGPGWAFKAGEHNLTADWHWDAVLAANGLAALALTPSPVDMIGQDGTLASQGLAIATEPVESRRDDDGFLTFKIWTDAVRDGRLQLPVETKFHFDPTTGTWTYYPHQMHMLGGEFSGDWRLKEMRGFGTFAWLAGSDKFTGYGGEFNQDVSLTVPVFGAAAVLVSGGKEGGKVRVEDIVSGFKAEPDLPPEGEQGQVLQMMVPGSMNYRNLRITALTPGICFYGIQTREKQPFLPNVGFDYSNLPPA